NAPGVWIRDGDTMRLLTDGDVAAIEKAFAASGRALL
ncbi:MAG: hypothetical protein JWO88_2836, partial [Frankiales bacterium]|nr:hypothetical protein [Frankiales bacterium]